MDSESARVPETLRPAPCAASTHDAARNAAKLTQGSDSARTCWLATHKASSARRRRATTSTHLRVACALRRPPLRQSQRTMPQTPRHAAACARTSRLATDGAMSSRRRQATSAAYLCRSHCCWTVRLIVGRAAYTSLSRSTPRSPISQATNDKGSLPALRTL